MLSHKAAHGIKDGANQSAVGIGKTRSLGLARFQVGIGRQARKADLDHYGIGHKLHDVACWEQKHQPIDGTCKIVYVERQKVGSESHVPGIVNSLSRPDLCHHFLQKGHVLMIHV